MYSFIGRKNWRLSIAELATVCLLAILFFVSKILVFNDLSALNVYGWLDVVGNVGMYTFLTTLPLFLFGGGGWASAGYFVLMTYLVSIDTILLFVRMNFDMLLDGSWVAIALGTSDDEVKSFLCMYWGVKFVIVVVAFGLCIYGIVRLCKAMVKVQRKIAVGGLFLFLFLCGHPIFLGNIWKEPVNLLSSTSAFFIVVDTLRNWRMYRDFAEVKNNPKIPTGLCRAFKEDASMGIFVVGESATRNHMSLYGYRRLTTSEFDKRRDELIAYSDCVAPASATSPCLRYIFTRSEVEAANEFNPVECTYPQVLRAAGFHTVLYSMQKRLGKNCGVEAYAFSGCDQQVYLEELQIQKPYYDDELLKYLYDEIQRSQQTNSVVFLHFWGSHNPASKFYPRDKAKFKVRDFKHESELRDLAGNLNDNGMNDYDSSIAYSDEVLGKILSVVENSDCPMWFVYLSDHGETPNAKGWRVVSDRDLWEVPLVFYFNRKYRELHPELVEKVEMRRGVPLQSDQLFIGLLRIAGVVCDDSEGRRDFLSTKFEVRKVRSINGGRNVYHW